MTRLHSGHLPFLPQASSLAESALPHSHFNLIMMVGVIGYR